MDLQEPPGWKKNAALLLTSQSLSLAGTSLVQYALLWHITLATGSGIMMTVYIIAGFLPMFIMSPIGGVWADRYDRKFLMMVADGSIALATLVLVVVLASGQEALWLYFAVAMVRAVGSSVQAPAAGAFLPQIIPEDKLMRVNGIFGTLQAVIGLGAPALSGILMSLLPLWGIFLIDVITAALAIGILGLFIPTPQKLGEARVKTSSYWFDLKEGLGYIRTHKYLIPYFGFLSLLLLAVTPSAFLTPLQVSRTYGGEIWRLTSIEMAFSAGMMAGAMMLSIWGGFKNRMKTMVLSTVLMGLSSTLLGLAPDFILYISVMILFGVALAFYNTPGMVILQEHVEPDFQGRVISVYTMLFTSVMPLAMVGFGPLAEVVSLEVILVVTGVVMLALGFVVPFYKVLMEAGNPVVKG